MGSYDVVTVGGGLGGAALAKALAGAGRRVLVLEQRLNSETEFAERFSFRGAGFRLRNLVSRKFSRPHQTRCATGNRTLTALS
jgi:choline dehydrogenase-like flavoprotein